MVLPCLAGVFNSICGSCFGWVGDRIQTEAGHLISYGDNIENLRKQLQDLSDAIKSVENRIREAESNRGETLVDPVVDRLLVRMGSLKDEASKIIADEELSSDCTCIIRLRLNLYSCYLTSKSARRAIDEAADLLEREKRHDRPVANVDYSNSLGVSPILDFEEFESRVLVSNQIMAALKDPNVNVVGVYGMGGAGKTTLAEKIGAVLQLDNTFSYVVLAVVSEKQNQFENNYQADLSNIQKQIAGGLKIHLRGKNLRDRAGELREQLQKKDKVLIILDDIWSRFELKDVGIPIDNAHNKFKILMTSRSEMVLRKQMDSTCNFGLDILPLSDAWILFDRMVGADSEYFKWRPIAEEVVKQCGGIPILLVTIARALRNEDSKTWEDAMIQLKQFDGEDIVEEAYKMIEVSYKFLKTEEIKKLLLLCAQLNHRSIPVDGLLKYAMGLNLFKGCKKVKEVSVRLHKYLRDLKGCCLLQDGNEEGMIKMHDVVHKFASFVAFRDHHVFCVADGELQDWPSEDEFETFSAVSFPYCHLPPDHMLPTAFDNPKLESFLMLMSPSDASFEIPYNFFVGMNRLKLMHLTGMSLSPVLVSSLGALVKLRTLCLDDCKLSDISVIGELPMLQALSLFGSSIILVPKEIGNLGSSLKLLDLRRCLKLEMIASGVISRLILLEDLRIGKSFTSWRQLEDCDKSYDSYYESDSDGVVYKGEVASLDEFKFLQNLINLEICIPDYAKMFPKDLVFKKLETFRIFIGWTPEVGDCILQLVVNGYSDFDSEGSKALMTRTESLGLEKVRSSINVSEMDPKGFPELKHLQLEETDGIHYIVKKNYNHSIFPKLETLKLHLLFEFQGICDDYDHPIAVGSFENLRVIEVSWCDLLTDLLSSNLAKSLVRLKEITVKHCERMETIIVSRERDNEEEIQIGFTHQLRLLKLSGLSRFMSFCSFKQIEEVPSPTHVFNKKIMFPKLEVLKLSLMKIEKLWDDHLAITTEGTTCWFQNLTSLKVSDCENLSYLFTFSMVKSLAQLKHLEVKNCDSIEEIVASPAEREMVGDVRLSFPKLDDLELEDLPRLKSFCHATLIESQLLRKLTVRRCSKLKTFMSAKKVAFPNMEELRITHFDSLEILHVLDCDKLNDAWAKIMFPKLEVLKLSHMEIEKIWDDHLAITAEGTTCWFQNLTSLEVSYCEKLSYLFTSSMVKSLAQLKDLKVRSCLSIEEIVASSSEREMAGDIQLSFPKLDSLKLESLPSLKSFCHANLIESQLLREVIIKSCSQLKTFMSAKKVAFPNLKELFITNCDSLEKVFDIQVLPMNVCPLQNLQSVVVFDCPALTSIFPTSFILTCEQLEILQVMPCDKLDLFGFNNSQQLNDELAKLISNLEICYVDIGGGLKLEYRNQIFKLEIDGCGFQVPPILFALLKSSPELDQVEVSNNSIMTQLFPRELDHLAAAPDGGDDMDSQANIVVRIGSLTLKKLPNMKQIWSEYSPLKYHVIPERLKLDYCDSLLSLAPPSTIWFKNLTVLLVWRCPMLIRLIASSSTAKSLVNLKELDVQGCDSLEEIVCIDGQCDELASNGEYIVFEKLEVLHLLELKSLTSFCFTSHCNFQFPSLNLVIVVNCPQMKFFCKGDLSTPKLIEVEVEKYDEKREKFLARWEGDEKRAKIRVRWEGDLNSTIRHMFEEEPLMRAIVDEGESEYEYEDESEDEGENNEKL